MTGTEYKCIEQIAEARRLYDQGRYPECLALIEVVRRCSLQCGGGGACSASLRIAAKGMTPPKQDPPDIPSNRA